MSLLIYDEERRHVLSDEQLKGEQFVVKLNTALGRYSVKINALAAFVGSTNDQLTSDTFSRFSKQLSSGQSHIEFGSYFAKYVTEGQLLAFEEKQKTLIGNTLFQVYPAGQKREEYLPITYGYPNSVPLGLDVFFPFSPYSMSARKAVSTRTIVLSKPVSLDIDSRETPSVLLLNKAIYLSSDIRDQRSVIPSVLYGVVGLSFDIAGLLKEAEVPAINGLAYRIADVTDNDQLPVWFVNSQVENRNIWQEKSFFSHDLIFAGRHWRIDTCYPYQIENLIHWHLVILAFGLFTALAVLLSWYVRRLLLAYSFALTTANRRVEIDELTNLYSRHQIQYKLTELISHCSQRGYRLAAFCLDLDHFKTINEAFGHETGDKLLVKVAHRLISVLPDDVMVGRLGGDEFLIIMVLKGHDHDDVELKRLTKELIRQISQSYFIEGRTLNSGCSVGVALYPEFGLDAATLVKNADMAMYEAKKSGRATYHFYDGEMGKRFARNVRIETRLRRALQHEFLELHFQPKVDLKTERCVGMEALLRWEDDELGSVSPAEFIPVAEQTGIILPLGEWVFEQACRHILEWQKEGIQVPPIAINCSAAQLKRPDFLAQILALLDKYQIDPGLLELEVTESILIEDAEGCAELLRQVSRLGMKLAIDDFGTGYSSLGYLKDLPFHYVKIDQIFIRDLIDDPDHAALTSAIIGMSHSLNLKVIAEGISDVKQLERLREYGCDIGQGYLFSKALGANSMASDPMIVALNETQGENGKVVD